METKISFCLKNNLSELNVLNEKIELFAEKSGISAKDSFALNLALDEIITNIVSYAYSDEKEHTIEIDIKLEGDEAIVTVTDGGKHFDPLSFPEPKKDIPLEERKIGGLGVHFAKKMIGHMSYERKNNKNILTLKKKLGGTS